MSSDIKSRQIAQVARELNLDLKSVTAAATLLDDGGTIPFIARYRKEKTGGLDEVQLAAIRDRLEQLEELDKRRETIIASIEKQGKLTPELIGLIIGAATLAELEDIYLPYRPKRKTRASVAREKGLEPLAAFLLAQEPGLPETEAAKFIRPDAGVQSTEEALEGARDIIAEIISEHPEARKAIRELFRTKGMIHTRVIRGKEQEGQKFKDYFKWQEPVSSVPSHRLLAIRRGEKEGVLATEIEPDNQEAKDRLVRLFVRGHQPASEHVRIASDDGYDRLLKPSMETEIRIESKMKADEEAIRVFAANLRELLLSSPLGQKHVLALDPGFRTGCKVVCLDQQGKLMHDDVIFPHEPRKEKSKSAAVLKELCTKYRIDAIAIGNGTAGRETETFVRGAGLSQRIQIIMVNESGASVYSASDAARQEFPDKDITVRGAVSIGRRLMDPLSELVKVEAKSIGVGQYQHDVEQGRLKQALDDVVVSCVNAVGVEVNTASKELLSYVAGIGPVLARSIVEYRNENGPFRKREDLMNINRFGEKAFEQAAGFLRIRDGENPLDESAVHPESYPLVEQMARDLACPVKELIGRPGLEASIDLNKYITPAAGLPTLTDILHELEKPGRDPRTRFEPVAFAEGIHQPSDLKLGMKVPGIVTNVTNFGAFVDIGVHQEGLVHISHLSDQFVKDPNTVISVGQRVEVTVIEVDPDRQRIALSMKSAPSSGSAAPGNRPPKPVKNQRRSGDKPKAGSPPHPRKPEQSMEDKLAQLMNKYRKK